MKRRVDQETAEHEVLDVRCGVRDMVDELREYGAHLIRFKRKRMERKALRRVHDCGEPVFADDRL